MIKPTPTQLVNIKIYQFGICALIVLALFSMRLFYLQINLGSYFVSRCKKNFMRVENTRPLRGNILDCNGELLATNRPVINLYWCGSGNNSLSSTQLTMLDQLGIILETNLKEDRDTIIALSHNERHKKNSIIATDISMDQLSKIEEQFPGHENLSLKTEFERFYPHAHSASHVLGYLGCEIDQELFGRMGLEKTLQETLRGQDGTVIHTINSVGRNMMDVELEKARAGEDVRITIDIALQKIAEDVFPKDEAGTFILMDPSSGDIKALVSYPSFDPSLFLHPISSDEWNTLQEKRPFLNRAFGASYPIGSIFKLATVAAALDRGMVNEEDSFFCRGYYEFAGRQYRCNCKQGHGRLSTLQAVARSCNILFYEIGRKIDIDVLADYGARFGLGRSTNSLFPEKTGLVPSRRWKSETKGERWWPGETLSAAIGQSFFLATPIQIARMISSIFTGYLVRPRILFSEEIISEPLNINAHTRDFLQRSMRATVQQGTGQSTNRLKDITIYAKTSTAQTSSLEKRDLGKEYLEHGWFVSYFSYKNYQPLTLIILVENAGSSSVATAIAKNFLIHYRKQIDSENLA
jgi:penicillin-binding protein 2